MTQSTSIRTAEVSSSGIPVAAMGWLADESGCGYYRVYLPLQSLAREYGVQVEVGETNSLPFTVLVAQRTHTEEALRDLRAIVASKKQFNNVHLPKIVYELDDDLWSIDKTNPAYDYYSRYEVQRGMQEALTYSDAVTVSTEPLAEIVREIHPNVYVTPNSVPDRLLNETAFPYRTGDRGKPYVMAWAGSNTHLDDFKQCVQGVNTILKLIPNSRMVFFGTSYSHLLDPAVRGQVRIAPWTSSVPQFHKLMNDAQLDVVLAPLAPTTFNKSKSNLRIIEASAMGIPVIATDFGPYKSASTNGGTFLVEPGKSWTTALNELSNPLKRLEMSRRGREWAGEYAISKNSHKWLEVYREVLSQ